jgi:hypothetical protein
VGFDEREVEVGGAVGVEQAEQSTRGASEMTAMEGNVFEKPLSAGARGHQAVSAVVLACVALVPGERVEVARVFDLPPPLPGALVRSDFLLAIEDAHEAVGGDEPERLSHEGRGNGVVVSVEAQIRRFAGAQGVKGIAIERMERQRQETWPLLRQGSGDGALVGVAGDEAGIRDALDPVVELGVEIVEGVKRACGEEGITQVADGALDAPLFVAPCAGDGSRGKVVVTGKLEKAGIESDHVPDALEHDGLQVVVEKAAGDPLERDESGVVATEEALEGLVEDEAGVEGPRERQGHHEAREPAP